MIFNHKAEILRKTAKILSEKNIDVILEGFKPRVEYDTVKKAPIRMVLPACPPDTPDDVMRALHGYCDHESGHLLFSSTEDITNTDKSKLWHYIHNCIDDPRVNRMMMDYYIGTKKNLNAAYDYLFDNLKDEETGHLWYSKEFVNSLDISDEAKLAETQLRFSSLWFASMMNCELNDGKYESMGLDRLFGEFNKKVDPEYSKLLAKRNLTTQDVETLSDYFEKFFSEEVFEKMSKESEGEGEEVYGSIKEGEETDKIPDSMEEQLSKLLMKKIKESVNGSKEVMYWTDRFDTKMSRDRLQSSTDLGRFEANVSQVANYVQKDIMRMLEQRQRQYYTGGYKTGRLDHKALHSVSVGNQNIFKRKNEIRAINSAVGLLIDMSGSMEGSKIQIAAQSAYAVAILLDRLNIPFEIYGFTTKNPTPEMRDAWEVFKSENKMTDDEVVNTASPEVFVALKEFDQQFDVASKKALASIARHSGLLNQNEDSKHVKKALERLSVRPEPVKALFVFSDGEPAFINSNRANSPSNLRYYARNAKKLYGVDIYSVGIENSAVSNYYDNYSVIHDLKDLPKATFEFLKKAI